MGVLLVLLLLTACWTVGGILASPTHDDAARAEGNQHADDDPGWLS